MSYQNVYTLISCPKSSTDGFLLSCTKSEIYSWNCTYLSFINISYEFNVLLKFFTLTEKGVSLALPCRTVVVIWCFITRTELHRICLVHTSMWAVCPTVQNGLIFLIHMIRTMKMLHIKFGRFVKIFQMTIVSQAIYSRRWLLDGRSMDWIARFVFIRFV